ncbi:MAG TPA: hypothetical protein V6D08_03035 [Candidatus Obscuribacterales bacterium]
MLNLKNVIEFLTKSWRRRYLEAGNPDTGCDRLDRLASDDTQLVRRRVAENPNTPETTLEQLAQDDDAEVRTAVAENSATPEPLLDQLAHDQSDDVRYSMAENANLPVSVLEQLAQDDNPYVSTRARTTLRRLARAAGISWVLSRLRRRR